MNIIERPLQFGGDKLNHPKLIVVHAMAEYILDPEPIFAPNFLEKYRYSVHALIVPNGDVMICRAENQRASHARGFNTDSLGVEFLVPGPYKYGSFIKVIETDYITQDAWSSGVELVSGWAEKYDISVRSTDDRKGVKRHSDISPGRKVDPGTGFKWGKFLDSVTE